MSEVCQVVAASHAARRRAGALAAELGLTAAESMPDGPGAIALVVDETDAWLQQGGRAAPGPVAVDFASGAMRHRRHAGHNEAIGKAVGVRALQRPRVFDATAGLGRDAFVLADLGCEVTLAERSPVLAWLLEQGVERGRISGFAGVREACERMRVIRGDSRAHRVAEGQVIYLDPMFADGNGKSAAKKDLALLKILHSGAEDEAPELLAWALTQPTPRIVIKRPAKAAPIPGRRPAFSVGGKAVRFDVIVL